MLLTPVNPMTATPHGAQEVIVNGTAVSWMHVMAGVSPFNLTGLPALSVPYAFSSEQLPIGIQLVGKWLGEATLLRLGAMLERKGGLGDPPPNCDVREWAPWAPLPADQAAALKGNVETFIAVLHSWRF